MAECAKCPVCEGFGAIDDCDYPKVRRIKCHACQGSGVVWRPIDVQRVLEAEERLRSEKRGVPLEELELDMVRQERDEYGKNWNQALIERDDARAALKRACELLGYCRAGKPSESTLCRDIGDFLKEHGDE